MKEDMKKAVENWPTSHLNGKNPDAITITTFFQALQESRSQYRSSDKTGQSQDSESPDNS